MEAYKKAHAAGKHHMGMADENDISYEQYSICRLILAIGIGVTLLVGAYQIGIGIIDAFEGALKWCVIHGANPFGWSL